MAKQAHTANTPASRHHQSSKQASAGGPNTTEEEQGMCKGRNYHAGDERRAVAVAAEAGRVRTTASGGIGKASPDGGERLQPTPAATTDSGGGGDEDELLQSSAAMRLPASTRTRSSLPPERIECAGCLGLRVGLYWASRVPDVSAPFWPLYRPFFSFFLTRKTGYSMDTRIDGVSDVSAYRRSIIRGHAASGRIGAT